MVQNITRKQEVFFTVLLMEARGTWPYSLQARLRIGVSGFEPWPGTLC